MKIQRRTEQMLSENVKLRPEFQEMKASMNSNERELKKLRASLSGMNNINKALRKELDDTKSKVKQYQDEIDNHWRDHDDVEQYTRKNSVEIYSLPKEACSSTEEVAIK